MAGKDPFELFSHESSNINDNGSSGKGKIIQVPNCSNLENDEVHRVLVSVIWTKLRRAIDKISKENSDNYVHEELYELNLRITPKDMIFLKRYINGNRSISPESVNKIFNEIFTSKIHIFLPSINNTKISFSVIFFWICCFLLTTFAIFLLVKRPILSTFLFCSGLTVAFTMYKRYSSSLADKMAHMTKYPDLPHECIPTSKQGWYNRFVSSWFTSEEICKEYFKKIAHDPIYDLNPAHIVYDILSDPIIHFSGVLGNSIGTFYGALNSTIPLYFVPFVVIFSCPVLYIILSHFLVPLIIKCKFRSKAKKKSRPSHKSKMIPSVQIKQISS